MKYKKENYKKVRRLLEILVLLIIIIFMGRNKSLATNEVNYYYVGEQYSELMYVQTAKFTDPEDKLYHVGDCIAGSTVQGHLYCIQNHTCLPKNFNVDYDVYTVEINGDKLTYFEWDTNDRDDNPLTTWFDVDKIYSEENAIYSYILYKGKDKGYYSSDNELSGTQYAVWKAYNNWIGALNKDVNINGNIVNLFNKFGKHDPNDKVLISDITSDSGNQTQIIREGDNLIEAAKAYKNGINNVRNGVIDRTDINNIKIQSVEGGVKVGPFKYEFSDGYLSQFDIIDNYYGESWAEVSEIYGSDGNVKKGNEIKSGEEFYIKLSDAYIDRNKMIKKIRLTLKTNTNVMNVQLLKSRSSKQNLLFANYSGEGLIESENIFEYNIGITGNLKIVKKDKETGSYLNGAKFKITGPNNYENTITIEHSEGETITNLPVGTYEITETVAPPGYNVEVQPDRQKEITVKAGETVEIDFENYSTISLQGQKVDADTGSSTNPVIQKGVKFKIYYTGTDGLIHYIKSYTGASEKLATIEFTQNEAEAKIFATGEDGKTEKLYNIPTHNYCFKEISLSDELANYYEIKSNVDMLDNEHLNRGKDNLITIENKQKFMQLSGYVFEDKINPNKNSTRDDEYTKDPDKLVQGVTVRLRDSNNNNSIIQETTTNQNGEYNFKKVEIDKLKNYYIEFEYNGLKYESVGVNLNKSNGSKAVENSTTRSSFNKSYSTITAGQENNGQSTIGYSLDENGNISNTLKYKSGKYESTLVHNTGYTVSSAKDSVTAQNGSKGVSMTATTKDAKYGFTWKAGEIELKNINLGIYERAQTDLAIVTDIDKIDLGINGYTHTYGAGQRSSYANEGVPSDTRAESEMLLDGFSIAAKTRTGKYKDMTYDRSIYDSYIAYTKNDESNSNRLRMYITYKIGVKNESTIAYVTPKRLLNYADPQLTFVSSYIMEGNEKKDLKWSENTDKNNSSRKVWESGDISTYIGPGYIKYIYLTYELNTSAISGLANLKPNGGSARVVGNTTEIKTYSSYDSNKNAYAAIDKDSAPGNLKFGEYLTYEDDTDSAPDLKITRGENPTINGTVFEDSTKVSDDKMGRLGDGVYESKNNTVSGVQTVLTKYNDQNSTPIKLYTLDNNGNVVTNDASQNTSNAGKYSFVGIIPGEYVVKYKYGNTADLKTKSANKDVTTQDYKSTIVTNDKLKAAVENKDGSEYWYQDSSLSNYSSALDDWETRKSINANLKNITYLVQTNYENSKDDVKNHYMVATTGKMDFAIEDRKNQVTGYDYKAPSRSYNIKFGIAERARQSLELKKKISYIKLSLATGEVLIQGDPRSELSSMNYVTYPGGILKIELDTEIMQGSTLEIQYAISVENKSEADYNTKDYYMYGLVGNNDVPVSLKLNGVVDYVDERLSTSYTDSAGVGEWKLMSQDELKNYVSDGVYNKTKNRKNTIIDFCDITVKRGETKTLTAVKTSKILSPSEDLLFDNNAEVVSVSNDVGRFYSEENSGALRKITPGNFNLLLKYSDTHESDDDKVTLTVVPSTGDSTVVYYVVGISCLLIITTGIVLIKKKVL